MSDTQTQFPLAAESANETFHCALHGTVSRCPFKWMTCTDDADLDRTTAAAKYLSYLAVDSPADEFD